MSAHDDFKVDLVAYLAEELDAPRRAEVEKHLEGCRSCRREARELREVATLLAGAPLEHDPPPYLEQRVLGLVQLDREAGDLPTPEPVAPDVPERSRAWLLVAPGVAACLILLSVAAVAWRSRAVEAEQRVRAWEEVYGGWGETERSVELEGRDLAARALTAEFIHHDGDNYGISLRTPGLAPTPDDAKYEVWLSGSKGWVSTGSFEIGGDSDEVFYFHLGEDPSTYEKVWVTLEPHDGNPAPNGRDVASADL